MAAVLASSLLLPYHVELLLTAGDTAILATQSPAGLSSFRPKAKFSFLLNVLHCVIADLAGRNLWRPSIFQRVLP